MVIVHGPAWQLLSFIYYVFTKHTEPERFLKKCSILLT